MTVGDTQVNAEPQACQESLYSQSALTTQVGLAPELHAQAFIMQYLPTLSASAPCQGSQNCMMPFER